MRGKTFQKVDNILTAPQGEGLRRQKENMFCILYEYGGKWKKANGYENIGLFVKPQRIDIKHDEICTP